VSPTATYLVPGNDLMAALVGQHDEILRAIEGAFPGTTIVVRGNEVIIDGADAVNVEKLFRELVKLLQSGTALDTSNVRRTIGMIRADEVPSEILTAEVLKSARGRSVRPKTAGQKRYTDAIAANTITFGIGPAGTGKSYLAVALAVQALQAKTVERIILTRPAVEAGERLGFLPGDMLAKVDPYLRPLYDALYDMLTPEGALKLLERNTIEVAPLAFMRGRAQPDTSHVLTPEGWRELGSLEVGDYVVGSDGLPTPVLAVYPQGEKEVFRVTATDGAATLCCAEHLWAVSTPSDKRRGRPPRVLQTSEMIGSLRSARQHRYELPMLSGPVEFEPSEVPMEPYALGLLLGDGCITGRTTPTFATRDPELAVALSEALAPSIEVKHKAGVDYVLRHVYGGRGGLRTANPVTKVLRELQLEGTYSDTKFIPAVYLYNSSAVRLAVLQGLLDTDGGPVTQRGRSCRINYSTNSRYLKDNVVFLVRSLGGVAYWRLRPAEGRKPGLARGRDVWHRTDTYAIDIRLPDGIQPFRLQRKRALYEQYGGGRPMRFVANIEPAGRAAMRCIRVAAADSLYVTDDLLLTHNTLNGSFIILDEAQNTTPEQMKMFLTRIGFGSKAVVTGDVTQVDLAAGKSGLQGVEAILGGVEDIEFVRLGERDVVRHKIVADIVTAYERHDAANTKTSKRRPK
jgi:phosphate starvation-inducible PhoH-like protein